eukprot:gene8600-9473_t
MYWNIKTASVSDVDDGEEIDSHDSDEESDDSDMPVRPNLLARQYSITTSRLYEALLRAEYS